MNIREQLAMLVQDHEKTSAEIREYEQQLFTLREGQRAGDRQIVRMLMDNDYEDCLMINWELLKKMAL